MVAVVLLVGGLAGCGASGSLPRSAATLLQPQVAAIRVAAAAGDPAGAMAAAVALRRTVTDLRAAGDLSAEQAAAILAAAAQVETQLALVAPPAAEDPTSATPTTATDGEHPHKDEGKGKGRGND
jgi:hypothetical protein